MSSPAPSGDVSADARRKLVLLLLRRGDIGTRLLAESRGLSPQWGQGDRPATSDPSR